MADSATEKDHAAARELQKYLGQVTAATFDIVNTPQAPAGYSRILVGDSPLVRELAPDVRWDSLGTDDILIKTVGNDLILSGGKPRGTVYAFYTFLRDVVGCRWWTPDAESIPRNANLAVPALNIVYRPPLEARFIDAEFARHPNFLRKLRLTFDQNFYPITHTIPRLLAADKYFVGHADWFMYLKDDGGENEEYTYLYRLKSLKEEGRAEWYEVARRSRRVPNGQPCLHSKGALGAVSEGVIEELEREYAAWKYPPKIVWVTQADGRGIAHRVRGRSERKPEGAKLRERWRVRDGRARLAVRSV